MRDLVWEFYLLLNPSPTAHFARFYHRSVLIKRPGRRSEVKDIVRLKRSFPPHTVVDSCATLLQTTSRSRAIAGRHHDTAAPIEPALLLKNEALEDLNQPPIPELRIDAATDLAILDKDWHRFTKYFTQNKQPHLRDYPDKLRYLAVPWSPWEDFKSRGLVEEDISTLAEEYVPPLQSCLRGVLNVYGTLHVLYILVEPELLQASKKPWPEGITWETDIRGIITLSLGEYVAAYVEGDIHPGSFYSGDREYFEIPSEQILQLAGLEDMIYSLEEFRSVLMPENRLLAPNLEVRGGRKEPVRLRLMSWKQV
ncbi:hypothetical protein FQN54_001950 [Arachnomyces sp. PD_36]|nr:hypothetical protein FQN54_001950 [Arachnomyces sp. PD_36]